MAVAFVGLGMYPTLQCNVQYLPLPLPLSNIGVGAGGERDLVTCVWKRTRFCFGFHLFMVMVLDFLLLFSFMIVWGRFCIWFLWFFPFLIGVEFQWSFGVTNWDPM